MYEEKYFEGDIHNFLRQVTHDLLLDDSAGRTARELSWTNLMFSHVNIIPPCSYITWGINSRPAGGRERRRSQTPST
jgi:hypothetical protein